MGLSYYCSNWGGTFQQHNHQEMGGLYIHQTQTTPPALAELPPELLTFHDDFSLDDTCIDPIFNPPPPHNYHGPGPGPSPSLFIHDHPKLLYQSTTEIFPSLLLDYSSTYALDSCPKRQKTSHHDDDYFGGFLLDAIPTYTTADLGDNGLFMNPDERPIWFPDLPLQVVPDPLQHHDQFQTTNSTDHCPLTDANYSCESISCLVDFQETTATSVKKGAGNAWSSGTTNLSAQSMAARLRRKKITDKTRELGKLIPGGHKMNTAEMFQAASKYIKFLQAQVGVLQHMPTIQKNEGGFDDKEFQALVTSNLVQEKFSAAEKCLVPRKLVENILADDHQFQSKPQLFKDMTQLIKKN